MKVLDLFAFFFFVCYILFMEKYKNQLRAIFKKNGAEFVYLFGSRACGQVTPESDVDIAVYLKEKKVKDFFNQRLDLIAELSRLFKKETDVVILNTAPPFLRYVVLKEGRLIFCANNFKKIDFELKSLNDYFDYLPILKIYNERLLKA